ncbi:MAG: urease subunit beta [Nitrospinaceae bacterium]|jgi:urease beta subunit|nr:urease subunit beta [Nitrospinaceae bacterium]MBT3432755.1 urease subunit beta [Nitrospinaceae bacterium]MBT3821049.1 urease subunit beta [Nitrospinaceae bacterium]MBT4094382.1 urease subunit beta [Nitrospinaceae bacterium]MBT4429822.1 urease subunit beta [Nitrospinaceae bacterium]
MIPGEYVVGEGEIVLNEGRRSTTLVVANRGDRPIQVGSHFHFFEVNQFLDFDRDAAFGMRLDIPAGTAVRFEPGDEKEAELVEFGGARRVLGLNALTDGEIDDAGVKEQALKNANREGYRGANS